MTLQQIDDLQGEGDALFDFLRNLSDDDWDRPTPFKEWTPRKILRHLHDGDEMAIVAIKRPDEFQVFLAERRQGPLRSLPEKGAELLDLWKGYFDEMCQAMDQFDPKRRVPWVGPDMSLRMMATARQMETWAHGQDIYDLTGVVRSNTDRLRNIAEIGVRTFGWTFVNRKMAVPGAPPWVELTTPTGGTWTWGEPEAENSITGSAVDFCHVVTQGRNIAEVDLNVTGDVAAQWMAIAQCFAGPPEDPPAVGVRTGG
jgi:uncharacterized protein (TIGR03084 family)